MRHAVGLAGLVLLVLLVAACGPSEEEIAAQVATSAAATVVAVPTYTPYATLTPYPMPTAYPTLTPYPTLLPLPTYTPPPTLEPQMPAITDLFCGYGFCIGHPPEAYLTDVDAPDVWSLYESGWLMGYDGEFMAVQWERASTRTWDPEGEVRDLIGSDAEMTGNIVAEMIGDLDVTYALATLTSTDTVRPYGVVAAWYCGDRGFSAYIMAERDGVALDLLREALERFSCGE